ncbi:MAG TPA: hypothetical protein VLF60_01770 [Candidatus Saccharimonadales bacterium]|nr:hypothetical protein [Candidatus Saccharimonadales bacterium]
MDEETDALPCSEKVAFTTQKDAKAAATIAAHWYGRKLKVYQCIMCGLWHLSSDYDT